LNINSSKNKYYLTGNKINFYSFFFINYVGILKSLLTKTKTLGPETITVGASLSLYHITTGNSWGILSLYHITTGNKLSAASDKVRVGGGVLFMGLCIVADLKQ
jgi:hypothetical protein